MTVSQTMHRWLVQVWLREVSVEFKLISGVNRGVFGKLLLKCLLCDARNISTLYVEWVLKGFHKALCTKQLRFRRGLNLSLVKFTIILMNQLVFSNIHICVINIGVSCWFLIVMFKTHITFHKKKNKTACQKHAKNAFKLV